MILTRELVRPHMSRVTVAPITGTIRGLSTEVRVGRSNGLEGESVDNCDNIVTVPAEVLGPRIGSVLARQEQQLTAAIHVAFDLA